jgi:lipoprotein-anchoring transpeptidase ErfK/SrfK
MFQILPPKDLESAALVSALFLPHLLLTNLLPRSGTGHRAISKGNEILRVAIVLSTVVIILGAFMAEATAQYYPPPPAPYGAPPPPGSYGAYRGAPMPDDDDDNGPPDVYSRPPAGVPNTQGNAQGPYHYGPPERYDPRSGSQETDANTYPAPQYGYGGAPSNGVIEQGRLPDIGASRPPVDLNPNSNSGPVAGLPPEDQPETGETKELPPNLRRQLVDYQTAEPAGTIIIDTPHTYLYLVLGSGKALRYGIGVGREGFTWSGREKITRMAEWPDWIPPKEMIDRQPYLPRFMAGGESNPLGARALYLGNSLYRIHGTNQPSTIGSFVSSGCIRLTNEDIEDLYRRVQVGTRVVVQPGSPPASASRTSVSAADAVH